MSSSSSSSSSYSTPVSSPQKTTQSSLSPLPSLPSTLHTPPLLIKRKSSLIFPENEFNEQKQSNEQHEQHEHQQQQQQKQPRLIFSNSHSLVVPSSSSSSSSSSSTTSSGLDRVLAYTYEDAYSHEIKHISTHEYPSIFSYASHHKNILTYGSDGRLFKLKIYELRDTLLFRATGSGQNDISPTNPVGFFAVRKEVSSIYGVSHFYKPTHPIYLLDIGDKETIDYLIDCAASRIINDGIKQRIIQSLQTSFLSGENNEQVQRNSEYISDYISAYYIKHFISSISYHQVEGEEDNKETGTIHEIPINGWMSEYSTLFHEELMIVDPYLILTHLGISYDDKQKMDDQVNKLNNAYKQIKRQKDKERLNKFIDTLSAYILNPTTHPISRNGFRQSTKGRNLLQEY